MAECVCTGDGRCVLCVPLDELLAGFEPDGAEWRVHDRLESERNRDERTRERGGRLL